MLSECSPTPDDSTAAANWAVARPTSRRAIIEIAVLLATFAAIQGCTISGVPESSRQIDRDPVPVRDGAISGSQSPVITQIGAASWYGSGFNGKKTASGELYDDSKFTAAHKTIALGNKAKVTHLGNGKSVEVVINDRGPYVKGRMIDLSQAAAQALGMIDKGVAKVQIELLQ